MKITINIDKEEEKILKKRAEDNFLSLTEQIEDIVRRSCINTKKKTSTPKINVDDKLVAIFSRDPRGRKPKKKKKVKEKKK
jgi:hypothetical protein